MWCSRPATRRVMLPAWSTRSVRTRLWVSGAGSPGRLWGGRVGGGWGGVVGQRAVWAVVVVLVDEGVELGLQFGDGGGWSGWRVSHFLRVWWKRSTLPQVVGWLGVELIWMMPRRRSSFSKPLRPPLPPDEAGGEDHAVVGQCGGRNAVGATALRNSVSTMGPVTRRWAVTESA